MSRRRLLSVSGGSALAAAGGGGIWAWLRGPDGGRPGPSAGRGPDDGTRGQAPALAQKGYECEGRTRAMDHMKGVRSVRTRKAVTRMRSDLARFQARGLRCTAELDERARDFLAGT